MYGILSTNIIKQIEMICQKRAGKYGFKYTRQIGNDQCVEVVKYIIKQKYKLLIIESSVFVSENVCKLFLSLLQEIDDLKIIYIAFAKRHICEIICQGIYNVIYYQRMTIENDLLQVLDQEMMFADVCHYLQKNITFPNNYLIVSLEQNNDYLAVLLKGLTKKKAIIYDFNVYSITNYLQELGFEMTASNNYVRKKTTVISEPYQQRLTIERLASICYQGGQDRQAVIVNYGLIYPDDLIDLTKADKIFTKIYLLLGQSETVISSSNYEQLQDIITQSCKNIVIVKRTGWFRKKYASKQLLQEVMDNEYQT